MAVSFVNRLGVSTGTAGTSSVTGSFTVVAGDYLIASIETRATGNQTPTHTISSTGSVTWTSLGFTTSPATTASGTGITTQVWHGLVTASGSSAVTVSYASATGRTLVVHQFRGVIASPTIITAIGTSTGAPFGPGAWTTQSGNINDAILWYVQMSSSGNLSPTYSTSTTGGTWAAGAVSGSTTGGIQGTASQYKILTANGTQSAFYTNGTSSTQYWVRRTLLLPGEQETTGSGSIELTASGTTNDLVTYETTALGEITLIATAEPSTIFITFPTTGEGSLELTATANATLEYPATGNGAIDLTGSANAELKYIATGAGAIDLTGSAIASTDITTSGTGAIDLTANGNITLTFPQTGTGSINLNASGVSEGFIYYPVNANGNINLTALGNIDLKYPVNGTGQIDLLGTAIAGLRYNATGAGSVLLEANATGTYAAVGFIGWGIPL